MRRLLLYLSPGLLLVCCDKPGSSDAPSDKSSTASKTVRLRHTPQLQTPNKPAEPQTILAAAIKIESPGARVKAIADVAWNAIEIDPKLATEAFQQLPADSAEKIRLIQHYVMRLAEKNPDEALAWASTLETEQEIATGNAQIALVLAETDPRRAATLLSESGIVGRDFDVAVVQVVQRWVAQSPPDTAAWVMLFPPGAAREAGIKILAEQWLARDAAAAFDWLEALQDEGLRKETLRAIEESLLQQAEGVRDGWLQHANPQIQGELKQQREQAIKEVGDNLPKVAKCGPAE